MMRTGHAIAGFSVICLLASGLRAQIGSPKPVSRSVAKAAQKEFASEYKSKDKKFRMAAVDRLAPYKHELIVKSLGRAMKDREAEVRAFAASLLGGQDRKPALKLLANALGDKRNRKAPKVVVAVFGSYRAHRACPKFSLMKKLFNTGSKELQREVLRTLRYCRTKESVKFLADLMDVPAPAGGNIDIGSNPPASYWKDKVTRWNFWFEDVSRSLVHLTGSEFDSTKEARGWLRSSAKLLTVEQGDKALADL